MALLSVSDPTSLPGVRFIPGAASGVCAILIKMFPGQSEECEECPNPITEADGEVWFCDAGLLKKKKRHRGLCYWHHDCLEPAPPSVAFEQYR